MTARGWLLFAAMSVIWDIPNLLIKIPPDGLTRRPSRRWRRRAETSVVGAFNQTFTQQVVRGRLPPPKLVG